jgi:hypothetical protein
MCSRGEFDRLEPLQARRCGRARARFEELGLVSAVVCGALDWSVARRWSQSRHWIRSPRREPQEPPPKRHSRRTTWIACSSLPLSDVLS